MSKEQPKILSGFLVLSTGVMANRCIGFVRELVTAFYFGTGRMMDAFVVAFTIPTLFRRVLGEEMIERSFVPPIKSLFEKGAFKQGWQLTWGLFKIMLFALCVGWLILHLLTPELVRFLAPGFQKDADLFTLTVSLSYWILPYLLIVGVSSFLGGLLLFFNKEIGYVYAPVMTSLAVIFCLFFFHSSLGVYSLPLGIVCGGLLSIVFQLPFFNQRFRDVHAYRYEKGWGLHLPETRVVGREATSVFFQSLIIKSVEIVDRIMGSILATGSISALYFAYRIVMVPEAVIGFALSRVLGVQLAMVNTKNDITAFRDYLWTGLRLNFFFLFPLTAGFILLSYPITGLVYGRGEFSENSIQATAFACKFYALGLPAMGLYNILARAFAAIQKNRVVLWASIISALLNIILNFILARTFLRHGGIALATSLAISVSAVFLWITILKSIRGQGKDLQLKPFFKAILKMIICLILMIFVCYAGYRVLLNFKFFSPQITYFIQCAIPFGCASLVYLGAGYGLRLQEVQIVFQIFKRAK